MLIPMKSLMLAGAASLALTAGAALALPSLPQHTGVPMAGFAPMILAQAEGDVDLGEDGGGDVVDDAGDAGGDSGGDEGVDGVVDEVLVDPIDEGPVDEGEVVDGGTDGCIDCSGITSVDDDGSEPEMAYDGVTPTRGNTEVQRGETTSVSRSSGGDSREANDACIAKVGKSRAFLCMN